MAVFARASSSLKSWLFLQVRQAQSSPQSLPVAKHSQYILRQLVFLQVQPMRFFFAELAVVGTKEMRSASESSSCPNDPYKPSYMSAIEVLPGKALTVLMSMRLCGISGSCDSEGKLKKEFLLALGCIVI